MSYSEVIKSENTKLCKIVLSSLSGVRDDILDVIKSIKNVCKSNINLATGLHPLEKKGIYEYKLDFEMPKEYKTVSINFKIDTMKNKIVNILIDGIQVMSNPLYNFPCNISLNLESINLKLNNEYFLEFDKRFGYTIGNADNSIFYLSEDSTIEDEHKTLVDCLE